MDKNHRKILLACFFAFFVLGIGSLIIGAIMPSILTDFSMGYDRGGVLLSSLSTGSLVASFLAGIISIYIGRKNAIVGLALMTLIGFLAMSLTRSPLLLLVAFFLIGASRGGISNISNTIVNDLSEGDPAPLNILHTFFAVGAFMAPFLAAWAINGGLTWRLVLGATSLLSLIMVIVFLTSKIENQGSKLEKGAGNKKESLDFLRDIEFYLSSGILFFYVAVEYAINGWIVTYLKDTGLMSTSLAQKILSLLWVVIIFGRLFSAYISKTVNKKTILLISSLGSMVFFGTFMISRETIPIIASVLGLGFSLAGIYPTAIANAGEIIKGSHLAMGIILGVSGLGGIVMPYITGLVAERAGIAGGMISISIAAILMFIFALVNKLVVKKVD